MNEFAPPDSQPDEQNPQSVDTSAPSHDSPPPESGSGFGSKVILKIGGFLAIVAVVIGMKIYNKDSTSKEVKTQAYAAFADYEDQAQIRRIIDKHHDKCFNAAYTSGGRRRAAKFDEEKYVNSMRNAIQIDLASENGALQDFIQDAQYSGEDEPIHMPDEIANPTRDSLEQELPNASDGS